MALVRNMTPALSSPDPRNLLERQSVVSGNGGLNAGVLSNGANLIIGQLGLLAARLPAGKVNPSHARLDGRNIAPMDTVFGRDLFGRARVGSDRDHLRGGQLAKGRAFLARHIKAVFFPRSDKQMARVAADRVVALVADIQAALNRAVNDLKHDPVYASLAALISHDTVAASNAGSRPRPAGIRPTTPVDFRNQSLIHSSNLRGSPLELNHGV